MYKKCLFELDHGKFIDIDKIIYLDRTCANLSSGLTIEITTSDYAKLSKEISNV